MRFSGCQKKWKQRKPFRQRGEDMERDKAEKNRVLIKSLRDMIAEAEKKHRQYIGYLEDKIRDLSQSWH